MSDSTEIETLKLCQLSLDYAIQIEIHNMRKVELLEMNWDASSIFES